MAQRKLAKCQECGPYVVVVAIRDGEREGACIGVSDMSTGEAVMVFAVKSEDSEVSEADIIAHCREYLTAYKVPETVVFIDEIPKSAVGKMLRRLLREA